MQSNGAELLARIAGGLSRRALALSEQLTEQMLAIEPELRGDSRVEALLRASVTGNVVIALHVYELGLDIDEIDAPAEALEYARRLAQRGTSITALLRAYRIGERLFTEHLLGEITAATSDPTLVTAAVAVMTDRSFAYIDRVSQQVVTAYEDERDRWLQNQMAVRTARVRSILSGQRVDPGDSELALGYRLDRTHLGLVVWFDAGTGRLRAAKQLATIIADQLHCQGQPLLIPADESTLWAWLPQPELDMDPAAVSTPEATWVAVGRPAAGLEGFRLTHRQAAQAQVVAMSAPAPQRASVSCSAQVGPIALMCTDLAATRAWISEVLGPLARDDDATAQLRETARVFLDTSGSFQTTAERLVLHRNTVQYRIRKAEAVLGHSLREGRLDIEVALLACRWLGSTVLQPMGG
ncbi:helix-turn-helix domain-containing protein [Nocardia sp. NBC_00508]|uniref:PucR family transcriptional regulator n=1 Tax=Nocardia sp. NBC_00508 TaxID=2975992 RepID=UPI002E804545|nr:helix-turn-helix domain-containing protein [Nocardia sp. NBC_00508]WUD67274.1 helix-turn-helix domain-containing protein [Nocardia sp. NBC_00508]